MWSHANLTCTAMFCFRIGVYIASTSSVPIHFWIHILTLCIEYMQIYSNICNAMLSYFFGSAKHHKVFSQFINMENSLQVLATLKRKKDTWSATWTVEAAVWLTLKILDCFSGRLQTGRAGTESLACLKCELGNNLGWKVSGWVEWTELNSEWMGGVERIMGQTKKNRNFSS